MKLFAGFRVSKTVALADDAYLVHLSRGGDSDAFSRLIGRYETPIYNLALRMVGRPEDASDITQEAFLRAWEKLRSMRRADFKPWLFQIAVNLCHDHFRRQRRVAPWPEGAEANVVGLPASGDDPTERAESNERMRLVASAIGMLAPELRTALVLRDVNDLAYDEMAEILEVPLGTVKSRIARARAQVQERLLLYPEVFNIRDNRRTGHGG